MFLGMFGPGSVPPSGGGGGEPLEGEDTAGGGVGEPLEEENPAGGGEGEPLEDENPAGGGVGEPLEDENPAGGREEEPLGEEDPGGGREGARLEGEDPGGGREGARLEGEDPGGGREGERLEGEDPGGGREGARLEGEDTAGGGEGERCEEDPAGREEDPGMPRGGESAVAARRGTSSSPKPGKPTSAQSLRKLVGGGKGGGAKGKGRLSMSKGSAFVDDREGVLGEKTGVLVVVLVVVVGNAGAGGELKRGGENPGTLTPAQSSRIVVGGIGGGAKGKGRLFMSKGIIEFPFVVVVPINLGEGVLCEKPVVGSAGTVSELNRGGEDPALRGCDCGRAVAVVVVAVGSATPV